MKIDYCFKIQIPQTHIECFLSASLLKYSLSCPILKSNYEVVVALSFTIEETKP